MSFKDMSKIVVVYPGRFHPFTLAHESSFKYLQSKFGKDNTFIVTSSKVEFPNSPFEYSEKLDIMREIFGIDLSKVVNAPQPYFPEDFLKDFSEDTALIIGVGSKDIEQMSSFFRKYESPKNLLGYKDCGYYVELPDFTVTHKTRVQPLSASLIRQELRKAKTSEAFREVCKQFFPVITKKIFKLLWRIFKESSNNYLLTESAGAGRIEHPHTDEELTLKDLVSIVKMLCRGNLEVSEKLDGMNLLTTFKDDTFKYARNKTEIKDPLTIDMLVEKFETHGKLTKTFQDIHEDLEVIFEDTPEDTLKDFFEDGSVYLNLEILHKSTLNVVPYEEDFVQVTNAIKFDEDYNQVSTKDIKSLLKDPLKNNPDTKLKFKPSTKKYLKKYPYEKHIKNLEYFLEELGISLTTKIKDLPKESSKELDLIFINLGNDLIKYNFGVSKEVVEGLVKRLRDTAKEVLKMNNPESIKVLSKEDKRLEATGGESSINSSEGFVFYYKDKPYKITGSFSALNKIFHII